MFKSFSIRIKVRLSRLFSSKALLYLFFARLNNNFYFFFFFSITLYRYLGTLYVYNEESVATKYDFWACTLFFCTGATLILIISARIYPRSYVLSPVTLARSV